MQQPKHIQSLDGLRFFAAFFVVLCHYSHWIINDQGVTDSVSKMVEAMSALGMALFFTLSGFVIHYNYHDVCGKPGGMKHFFIARFSRLYPLFFLMIAIEFISSFNLSRGSCAQDGDRMGAFLALPYYLTLTHAWFFGVICKNNLLVQYHMVGNVSWSLSVESFFYLCYALFIVQWLARQKCIVKQIAVATLANILVVGYFLLCWYSSDRIDHVALVAFGPVATLEHGYENSLLRWLYYFNPLMNLVAFLCGTIAANIHMKIKDRPITPEEEVLGFWLTTISIAAVFGAHFWIYTDLGMTNAFVGRTGSSLYVPLVAIMIFCVVRYSETIWSRFLALPFLVRMGQASYSIYLLHAFFGWNARDFYYLKLNPWLLYVISISCVLVVSRISYLFFERPAQRWLRRRWEPTR